MALFGKKNNEGEQFIPENNTPEVNEPIEKQEFNLKVLF